ncbi:MAG: biotin/lipoyl-binding protein, partial [Gammaproteobacteria bacterium]|nr:biotin/lipoyl-binding protein [Gammaproteobacteria bacterium]
MASTGSFKRFASRLLGLLLLVALVTVGVREGLHWYRHVYEPNASIEADITRLASSVNAKVQTIHVQRGQSVRRGELLASMEADVARLEVDSIAADLEKEKAVRAQVEAELAYFRTELDDRVATAREAVRLLDDERATLRERLAIARKNVERNSELLSRSMVARQRIDEANDKLLEVTGLLRDLETKLKTAERRLDEL